MYHRTGDRRACCVRGRGYGCGSGSEFCSATVYQGDEDKGVLEDEDGGLENEDEGVARVSEEGE